MKPRPGRTISQLHFEDLEPHRFEDLVRQLAYGFRDWVALEPLGRSGSDEGIDIRGIERVQGGRQDEGSSEDPGEGQCPAEWWGLRVDLRCLRAAVDRGGGVSIAGRVELGHGALGAVAELEPLIGIV